MTLLTTFVLAFGLTLASLVVTMITGLRWRIKRRRKLHMGSVVMALGFFAWTIATAYKLGALYDLDGAGWIYPVHMVLARTGTAFLLLPVISGVCVLKTGKHHARHRMLAFVAFGTVTLAAITGFLMLYMAPYIEPVAR